MSDKMKKVKLEVQGCRIGEISGPLLAWYDGHKRSLPWRDDPTPYKVWVSEIMLQQTRVEAVKPYFERFMKALPDVKALSEAEEENLLKLWEGLGYYNRVRNMQKAAKRVVAEHKGEMPADHAALLALEGIGSYTAGAIASIAFGIPKPAVDGNVLRVLSRLRMDERPISDHKVREAIGKEMEEGMPKDRPGDFNQAMMEIGAMVCLPNGMPHCTECPLADQCLAHRQGKELSFPKKEAKKARSIEKKTILVIRDANNLALRKRGASGLLAGMYEFPSLTGWHSSDEVLEFLAKNGIKAIRITPLPDSKHIFTHKEWHMKCFMIRVDELEQGIAGREVLDWIYVSLEEIDEKYPIPSAFAAYRGLLRG